MTQSALAFRRWCCGKMWYDARRYNGHRAAYARMKKEHNRKGRII